MSEVYGKPALTFEKQLEQLESRGIVINDHAHALSQVSAISYYRLSAYWYPFRIKGGDDEITSNFVDGTCFDDVVGLYEFDRRLRLLVIDAIERVEVYIRTLITYHLGRSYGAFGHTDQNNFHLQFEHRQWLKKLEDEARRSSDAFIAHYKKKYSGFPTLPVWMLTEVMSLGSLSFCYRGLKHNDKKLISEKLGLHYKRLEDWLHKLTYIRNVCAHHSRLWNRELAIRPENSKLPEWSPPVTPRNDRVFYILLMLRVLLRTTNNGDDWSKECNALLEPVAAKDKWRMAMGMPDDWKEHPIWK